MHNIDIVYVFHTHTWVLAHMCSPFVKCTKLVYSIMLPLMTLTLLPVYYLFYHIVWLDFIPVNFTFVCQVLPIDSENDLLFQDVYQTSSIVSSTTFTFIVLKSH